MPVYRYRSIEEMPRRWREPHDPAIPREIGRLLALHRAFTVARPSPGVRRYRSAEEMEADRADRRR